MIYIQMFWNSDIDASKDYYKVFGISEDASDDEIKKAYRKLAMEHHPDRNKGNKKSEDTFKEINAANDIIGDPEKRKQYDAMRKGWFGAGWFWGFGGWGGFWWWGFGGGGFQVDLWDIMDGFFGGGFWGGSRNGPMQWDDLVLQLTINFEESFHGTSKTVSYSRSTMAIDVTKQSCSVCGGRGVVAQQVRTPFGVMQSQAACSSCWWAGDLYYRDGQRVADDGLEKKSQEIKIDIPVAIENGTKIRYMGMGNDGTMGGPSGDLYVKIMIKGSDKWKRDGTNLIADIDISIYDAVLGATVEVDHPDGKMSVKIPKGLQVGEYVRVSGKWFWEKGLFSKRGDLIVKANIKIPKKLSGKEEKLRTELKMQD
jgi:molecular chaperone DnaJ